MSQQTLTPPPSPRPRRFSMRKEVTNQGRSLIPIPVKSPKPESTYIPYNAQSVVEEPVKLSAPSVWDSLRCARKYLIGDSLDFGSLTSSNLHSSMLTPSGFLSCMNDAEMFYHAYVVGQRMSDENARKLSDASELDQHILEHVQVELARAIMEQVPGPHFTFIDTRYHFNPNAIISRVANLVRIFEKVGLSRERIVVSVPSTEAGVHATRALSRVHDIRVNLTFVCDLTHAVICAEAGAAYITFNLDTLSKGYALKGEQHLAVESVKETVARFKQHGLKTKIIVSDIRQFSEIQELHEVGFFSFNSSDIVKAKETEMPKREPAPMGRPSKAAVPITTETNPLQTLRLKDSINWLRDVPAATSTLIHTTHEAALSNSKKTMTSICRLLRENVTSYRMMSAQMSDPVNGLKAMRSTSIKKLVKLIMKHEDVDVGFGIWASTATGRMIQAEYKIEFHFTDTDFHNSKHTPVIFRELPHDYLLYVELPSRLNKAPPENVPTPIERFSEISEQTMDLLQRAKELIEKLDSSSRRR